MISKEVDKQLFETLLKLAVIHNHRNEQAAIPAEEELSRHYSFSAQFTGRIRRMIWRDKYTRAMRSFRQGAVKTAAVIALILAITLGSIFSIAQVRATVLNAVMEWLDTYTDFRFIENTSREETAILWRPAYVPDGFHESALNKTGAITTITYQNNKETQIYFIYASAHEGYSFAIDNEHSEHSQVKINGVQADLFKARTDQDSSHVIWQKGNSSLHIMSIVNYEELLKMAASTNIK